MAMELEFTGWLNEVKDFGWGKVCKMTHQIRKQNAQGVWETVGRDYVDVVIESKEFDNYKHILNAAIPTRVHVVGNTKPQAYEVTRDGERQVQPFLKVWPSAMEIIEKDLANSAPKPNINLEDAPF
jgi:hypothetical protein